MCLMTKNCFLLDFMVYIAPPAKKYFLGDFDMKKTIKYFEIL